MSNKSNLNQDYIDLDEYVRNLIVKVVRLTAFDCHCLKSTIFMEDPFLTADEDIWD
ncbi:hypothetical protein ACS125_18635 [Acinetobacter sp. PFS20]|uniref:hypothetical protein n=1 Tax=Acinetobacter sp. PFS20 TaxID=3458434 RepID=UPI003FCF78D2